MLILSEKIENHGSKENKPQLHYLVLTIINMFSFVFLVTERERERERGRSRLPYHAT
jgi:hypothetical protein